MSQPWTHSTPGTKAYDRVDEHYVEPFWVSERLFAEEPFEGTIYDPACGFGRILISAMKAGYSGYGSDIADRGWDSTSQNFFTFSTLHRNIVCNPPFDCIERFTKHALARAERKVAMIMPTARLNAAHWLLHTPLRRIWLLTPRPSMPPGHVIKAGGKVSGGKSDYCWLVFEQGYTGAPEMRWLHRDKERESEQNGTATTSRLPHTADAHGTDTEPCAR
jgi:hypothetical protein